ncbi:MAG: proline iminopeptidase-family hydrolase [Bryobacterales bacterium]|nr:proline iminopeptidase-family hydrolase [Bryobacterales bacterium]
MARLIPVVAALLLLAPGALPAGREGFVNVPGGPVWYRITGDGKGIPILALHGGPGGMSCHFEPLAALGSTRPVVVYDQLGSGRSGRPTGTDLWTVERFVEELDVVRRELGLKQVHLLGHSWGAALAAEYVLSTAGRGVASLILASPLLSAKDWLKDARELRRQLPPAVAEALDRHEREGTTHLPEYREAEREYYRRFVHRTPPRRIADCAGSEPNWEIYEQMWGPSEFRATGSLRSFDVTPRLASLRMPVLLIVGQYDEARPETAARYRERIPGARLAVIPDAAHSLFGDAPNATLRAIRSFLEGVPPR